MKTTQLIVFCTLFACKMGSIRSRDSQMNKNDSFSKNYEEMRRNKQNPKESEFTTDQYESDESPPASNANQDLSLSTEVHHRKNSIKKYNVQWEPNVFQKILVPVGGPYCYPEILNVDLDADVISRRKTGLTYSPQQKDESFEIMASLTPRGTIEGEWPYQLNQSQKEKEIRKYVKLNVSLNRRQEEYRLTGKAAERAFISRYYGFINTSENRLTDDLITFIEDSEKFADHLVLDSRPDPLADFNSWEDENKMKFCAEYINYSIVLFNQNIDFDPFGREKKISRKQATVKYKNAYLQSFEDTEDIVICPCTETTNDTPLELGVSPIRYAYEQDFPWAFVYDILKDGIEIEVSVRALTNIDFKGLAKDRKKRDQEQRRKRKRKEEEEKKLQLKIEKEEKKERQREEANENGEGKVKKVLHKLFSFNV